MVELLRQNFSLMVYLHKLFKYITILSTSICTMKGKLVRESQIEQFTQFIKEWRPLPMLTAWESQLDIYVSSTASVVDALLNDR